MATQSSGQTWTFPGGTLGYEWDTEEDNGHRPAGLFDVSSASYAIKTVNLLADMGIQPGALQSNLVPATASADHTAAASTITSPTPGATVAAGNTVEISGTAADEGGGVVAGVEVSTDGGATWHPAQGTTSWSYNWTPATSGAVILESRSVDDSGNLETPTDGLTVRVGK